MVPGAEAAEATTEERLALCKVLALAEWRSRCEMGGRKMGSM